MRIVVCDTGPLIHLEEARRLDLLPATGRVAIPPAVAEELSRHRSDAEVLPWLDIVPLAAAGQADAERLVAKGILDLGEAQAVLLCRQLRADWLLTDDSAARWYAKEQGLEVHGSLGVVLWSVAQGTLSVAEGRAALLALNATSLWIAPAVLEEALQLLAS